jgi:FHA domain
VAHRTLRINSGPGAGRTIDLDQEVVLGREGVDVTIQDPELSRRHAAFRPVERGVEVEDLGSLNGTFVNGRRLSGPETLTETSQVKLGTSEGSLEISLPQPEPIASPEATRPHQVAQPDVTAPRKVADPDVTAPRQAPPAGAPAGQVAQPDVTAPRQVAQPDVTAPRKVPGAGAAPPGQVAQPDVTAPRQVADPDVTVQRPTAEAGPPGPPAPPAQPGEPSGGRGGPPIPLIAGLAALVVAIVVAVILLSGGGEEAQARQIRVTHEVRAPTAEDKRKGEQGPGREAVTWTLVGKTTGRPFGNGDITAKPTLQPVGPPPGAPKGAGPPPGAGGAEAKKALVTVRVTIRFRDGTIFATERLENERVGDRLVVNGRGRIIRGTGAYEGATGTFRVTGERPKFTDSRETVNWRGTVEY